MPPELEQIKCGDYTSLTKMFQDILKAVEVTGEQVLCADDPVGLRIGYVLHVIRDDLQYEWRWNIHLHDLARNTRKIPKWRNFRLPLSAEGRAEIAATLSRGEMPS